MERIFREPHVFTAGRNRISSLCCIVFRGTGVLHFTHVDMPFKHACTIVLRPSKLLRANCSPHNERNRNNPSYRKKVSDYCSPSSNVSSFHVAHLPSSAKREVMPPPCSCQFVLRSGLGTVPNCTGPQLPTHFLFSSPHAIFAVVRGFHVR